MAVSGGALLLSAEPVYAAAGPEDTSIVELALRASWSLPQGQLDEDQDLARLVVGQAPLELSVGWRAHPHWVLGAFAQYGVVFVRDCGGGCTGNTKRIGIQLHHHFTPDERVDHWLGVGAGYEWLSLSIGDSRISYRGFEWLSLMFGEEFQLGQRAGIGPVFSLSLAQYTDRSRLFVPGFPDQGGPIKDKMVHVWVNFGVRASYGL